MPPFRVIEIRKASVLLSAVALVFLATWFLLGSSSGSTVNMTKSSRSEFVFETVTGLFMQDDPSTEWDQFDFTTTNFGLIDRKYDTDTAGSAELTQWQRFERYVQALVADAPEGVSYKVLYMGRHGQGDHNVAESFYGTKAWDDYWSKLEGNGTVVWADAHLTSVGEQQILHAHEFMAAQLGKAQMPAPQSYYVSPLYRCLQTANLTYTGLDLPHDRPFKPVIKELLRETNGEHTCDRRSSRTHIHKAFPEWQFEPGFTETDELWRADHRETHEEHDVRTRAFLTELFEHDRSVFVSLTSHSGAIASKLRVIGHREFGLGTGGMIPALIKATRV